MKTTGLLFLTLLLSANLSFAEDASSDEQVGYEEEVVSEEYVEYEGVQVYDPRLKPNTIVVEVPTGEVEDSEEVYHRDADGNVKRVAPYNGVTLLGASFEHGSTGGDGYSISKNGGRLQLSLPVIGTAGVGKGGDSVTGANLGRLRLELGAGHIGASGNDESGSGWYAHGSISPTIGLFVGDQPKVYEKGTANPNIFGVEMGPSVGFMCNNMDDTTKTQLGITDSGSCNATVGAIFRATISYLNLGVDVKRHLGEDDAKKDKTEFIFNIGIEVPLSANDVDTNVNDSERGKENKERELPASRKNAEETRAVSA